MLLRIIVYVLVLLVIWASSVGAAYAVKTEGCEFTVCLSTNGYETLKEDVNSWSEGEKPGFVDCNPYKMDSLMGYTLKYFTPTCLILAFAQNTSSFRKDLEANTLEVEI